MNIILHYPIEIFTGDVTRNKLYYNKEGQLVEQQEYKWKVNTTATKQEMIALQKKVFND